MLDLVLDTAFLKSLSGYQLRFNNAAPRGCAHDVAAGKLVVFPCVQFRNPPRDSIGLYLIEEGTSLRHAVTA